jgi:hypothetical protein
MILKFFPEMKGKKSLSSEEVAAGIFTLKVLSGEPWAMLEYFNREEGRVTERIDHTTKGKELKGYTVLAHPDMWDEPENNETKNNNSDIANTNGDIS